MRPMSVRRLALVAALAAVVAIAARAAADDPAPPGPATPPAPAAPPANPPAPAAPFVPDAARGYRHLVETAYIPAAFDDTTFDALWTTWPAPLRDEASRADAAARRALTFRRYGFTPRPDDPSKPLQYVVDARGAWSISCFACHAGAVAGRVLPGLPNAHFAFQDLMDDVAKVARTRPEPQHAMAAAMWRRIPLGETHGTTNAVVFSLALGVFRDEDLRLVLPKERPVFVHHDLDAPPWWNVRKRPRLYVDGVTAKSHRSLMQFLLVPQNGRERLLGWEDDFRDVLAYVESVPVPRWPFDAPDAALVARGRAVHAASCAKCHGTPGEGGPYPSVRVPRLEIGTDPLRLTAIPRAERERFARSWFTGYDPSQVDVGADGYVAPPLDGVWASAPYFHNGSVPTLWHVLHPEARPAAWRRKGPDAYDRVRGGLEVEVAPAVPPGLETDWDRRAWFDTTRPGKSAAGHAFPSALSEADRRALLEFLKTL